MKDSIYLLIAAVVCSALAWVFWHYVGPNGLWIIVIIMITYLSSEIKRLRKENRILKEKYEPQSANDSKNT